MRYPRVLFSLLFLCLLIGGLGCDDTSVTPATLASANGVTVIGDPQALPAGVVLSVRPLTRSEAAGLGALPSGLLFAAAAECLPDHERFLRPVTLSIRLPNALAPNALLPAYRFTMQSWESLGTVARVSPDGATVSLRIAQCGAYLVGLNEDYSTMTVDGTTLVYQNRGIPSSTLRTPRVLASGKVSDPDVLAMVQQITGRTEAQAVELLRSFDTSGDQVVQVLELTQPLYTVRYWGPSDKLGRWYAPVDNSGLLSPAEARRVLALPNSNNAYDVTLYMLKPGAKIISGAVADMSANTEVFGPYATGGGWQYYAPEATVWVTDHAEINPQVMTLVAEVRFPQP